MDERLREVLRLLQLSKEYRDPNPGRDHLTGFEHALRCMTLGLERGMPDSDMAFIGLVHDLARPLNDVHHGEVMAEMVRDRVSENTYWVLRTHGEFQGALMHGTGEDLARRYCGLPWYRMGVQFAAFEAFSFSSNYLMLSMTEDQAVRLLDHYLG